MKNAQITLDQEVIIVKLTSVEIIKEFNLTELALLSNVVNSRSLDKMELHASNASHIPDHKIMDLDVVKMIAQEVSSNSMELAWHMVNTIQT